jgi:hypothetical protein
MMFFEPERLMSLRREIGPTKTGRLERIHSLLDEAAAGRRTQIGDRALRLRAGPVGFLQPKPEVIGGDRLNRQLEASRLSGV